MDCLDKWEHTSSVKKQPLFAVLRGKTYKINGWSQAGLVVFFETEVLNFCGGSSNCSTHRGFMLPTNTAENGQHHRNKKRCNQRSKLHIHYKMTADHIKCAAARFNFALVTSSDQSNRQTGCQCTLHMWWIMHRLEETHSTDSSAHVMKPVSWSTQTQLATSQAPPVLWKHCVLLTTSAKTSKTEHPLQ